MKGLDPKLKKEWEEINEMSRRESFVRPHEVDFLFDYIAKNNAYMLSAHVNVLDIGCGHGIFSRFGRLNLPKWSFVGADYDLNALKTAVSYNWSLGNYFVQIGENPTTFPFKNNSFDIITAMNIYDYQDNDSMPENYADEISRVMRRGGIYALSDFFSIGDFDKGHQKLLNELKSKDFEIRENVAGGFYQSILTKK